LRSGVLEDIEITPEDVGLTRRPLEQIAGGSPGQNAARLEALLSGRGPEADTSIVGLNAGALLATAGRAQTLREGVEIALEALRSGTAGQTLFAFVEASRG
jgi:anthranilate phosphoribosyltransferase